MKILFIIDCLSSGGKERRITELMKMLALKQNIEFELVVMNQDIHFKEVLDLNIIIHYIIRKSKKDLSVFYKLYKLCKKYQPNIVHCWDSMTAVYCVPVCQILRIPLVNGMVIDSPQKQNIFNKYWFRARLTFPFSSFIVGNSRAGINAYRAPAKKSNVIFNGFNFKRLEALIEPSIILTELEIKTRFVIGMVASFSVYKDYKTYLRAAEIILDKRTDITFLAIGSNTESFEAKCLVAEDKIHNFRFLGRKSGIESYVNVMDICVLATFTEGISNSILEYMALGKPVIATSGGGTEEIIEDNKTGFLVSVSNPVELAEKMELLLNNSTLRMQIGNAAKNRIKEVFSIETMLDNYISLYRNVAK